MDDFRVVAGSEFARVQKALQEQDKTLPRKFRRNLKKAAEGTVKKVQAAALDISAKGTKSTGVRKRLARGTRLRTTRTANNIRIITSMRDQDEAALPRGFDSPVKGWRHPVFNSDTWVKQVPEEPWKFKETIADDKDNLQRSLVEVLEEARTFIHDAGA